MKVFGFKNVLKGAMLLGAAFALTHSSAYASQNMYLCITTAPGNINGDCSGTTYSYIAISSDGTVGGTTISDNGSYSISSDTVSANGISLSASIGTWTLNITSGETGLPGAFVALNSTDSTSAAGTLDIYWNVTGFTTATAAPPFSATATGTNNLGSGSTVAFQACVDNNSLPGNFCGGSGTSQIANGTYGSGGFNQSYSQANSNSVTPFGIFEEVNLTATAAGTLVGGNFNVLPAPEPTSILLFGGALAFACGAIRRKIHN